MERRRPHHNDHCDRDGYFEDMEDDIDVDDDEYAELMGSSNGIMKQPELRRQSSASILRQSRPYVLFNVAVLVLLTILLIWVIMAPGYYPTSPIFVMLEILVTTIVSFQVGVEIAYYGCWSYFFPDALPEGTSPRLHCSRIAIHLWNWFQFFLVILCVMSLLLFLRGLPDQAGDSEAEKEEAELDSALILGALIGRYVFYVTFVCVLQWKVTQSQGGWDFKEFRTAFMSCLMCDFHVTPPLKQQWDIMIEEEAD